MDISHGFIAVTPPAGVYESAGFDPHEVPGKDAGASLAGPPVQESFIERKALHDASRIQQFIPE